MTTQENVFSFDFGAKSKVLTTNPKDCVNAPFEVTKVAPSKRFAETGRINVFTIIDEEPVLFEEGQLATAGIADVCDATLAAEGKLKLLPGAVITIQGGSIAFGIK